MSSQALKLIFIGLIAYALGNINPSIIIGKFKGIDIRKEGSGNAGMTNTIRVMGMGAGITVFIVDVLKAFIAVKIGISLGGQPIIGFNIGAGKSDRVRQTVSVITKLVISIGVVCFMIFELLPDMVISIFGKNNSAEYMEYAKLCIRIFLSGIIFTCYINPADT